MEDEHRLELSVDSELAAAPTGGDRAELYRDLLYPGGIQNTAPATVVGLGVSGLLLGQAPGRLAEGKAVEGLLSGAGLLGTYAEILSRPTIDGFWDGHSQRPGPNTFPVLANKRITLGLLEQLGSFHFLGQRFYQSVG